MPKHKHSEVIKAWADGVQIQYLSKDGKTWCDWTFITAPSWHPVVEYRVKPVPHKWQKEMDAFKEGKTIQFFDDGRWWDWKPNTHVNHCPTFGEPMWHIEETYRIKPEKVSYVGAAMPAAYGESGFVVGVYPYNLELTFEDGKLISAKVLVNNSEAA